MSETRIDRVLEADPREEKLPRWARDQLSRLRMRLGEARDRIADLTDGPADSDTIADPYSDYPQRLKRGTAVEFYVGTGRNSVPMAIRVRVQKARSGRTVLDINANDTLLVLPGASNAVQLEVRER